MKQEKQKKRGQANTFSAEELEDIKRRMDERNRLEEQMEAEAVPTEEYLEGIRRTHKDPYWMSYEVVQLKDTYPVHTVFTSEHYYEALEVFNKYFSQDRHARMDMVVRQVRDGIPLFRGVVLELEEAGGTW